MGDLLPMSVLMAKAYKEGYAIPAFCSWNAESTEMVLKTAAKLKAPVIVMSGPGEFPLVRPDVLAAITRHLIRKYPVPAALHLDHGDSLEMVDECLAAGYTSAMLDYSTKPWDENVNALREVVKRCRPKGVTVEGEIGHVGKADTVSVESDRESTLTLPEEAVAYVEATGVDVLAISIGNAHGHYTRLPRFDFERLSAIRKAVNVPLVLHGGSGTPPEDLRRAISLGMAKVNVATDLVTTVRNALMKQWQEPKQQWVPTTMAVAAAAMEEVIERWMRATGAVGRA
jgi:tagatose 1,6-diphosphate aldolase GatY/KbaY